MLCFVPVLHGCLVCLLLCLGEFVILLLNVMELLCVVGGDCYIG